MGNKRSKQSTQDKKFKIRKFVVVNEKGESLEGHSTGIHFGPFQLILAEDDNPVLDEYQSKSGVWKSHIGNGPEEIEDIKDIHIEQIVTIIQQICFLGMECLNEIDELDEKEKLQQMEEMKEKLEQEMQDIKDGKILLN